MDFKHTVTFHYALSRADVQHEARFDDARSASECGAGDKLGQCGSATVSAGTLVARQVEPSRPPILLSVRAGHSVDHRTLGCGLDPDPDKDHVIDIRAGKSEDLGDGSAPAGPSTQADHRRRVAPRNQFAPVAYRRLLDRAVQIGRLEQHLNALIARSESVPVCDALTVSASGITSLAAAMVGILSLGGIHPGISSALLAGGVLCGAASYARYRGREEEEDSARAAAHANITRLTAWIGDLRQIQSVDPYRVILEQRVPAELAQHILEFAFLSRALRPAESADERSA
ncbi:MAG: hypothetical protein RIS88_1642 [Pseudomonadota bacterium]|jgi:hypothetical protein